MSKRRHPRPHHSSGGASGSSRSVIHDTVLLRRGRELWGLKRWDEALQIFERAVAAEPDNARVLVDAARAFGARYRFGRADELLRRLLDRHGSDPLMLAHAGESYRLINRFAEAVRCFERSLALAREQATVGMELARLYERLHRLEEGLSLIERVLQTNRPGLRRG